MIAFNKTFYVTTPIYYVNASPHIGQAYTTIAADVLARFYRLDGYKVMFSTGTDEHGQKVEKSANAAGMEPQDFVDRVSEDFRSLGKALNLSEHQFIRTTEARHKRAAQALWTTLVEGDQIYLSSYAGWYSLRDETFYAEDELVDGKAPTGADVEWVEEPSYFFRLSAWQEPLLEFYKYNPDFIGPASRRNEVMRFVERGLRDLSISRSTFRWGVPVPGDEKHVMYVWIDALVNYLTILGYPDTAAPDLRAFWPHSLHLVGKDILMFHAVYWPALLMAAGLKPPRRVFAHGWWTSEGQKISKSLGNTIDPIELVTRFGVDQVRYFLMREVPFGNDGDFSRKALIQRINSDLANDFGNLVQRVLAFITKFADSKIPDAYDLIMVDVDLKTVVYKAVEELRQCAAQQSLHKMCEILWTIVTAANRYMDATQPWALRKTDPKRLDTVLYVLADIIRQLAILASPIIPEASKKILDHLHVPEDLRTIEAVEEESLALGTRLIEPQPIFPRIKAEDYV
jgi:methionyl-tRNA synthetase